MEYKIYLDEHFYRRMFEHCYNIFLEAILNDYPVKLSLKKCFNMYIAEKLARKNIGVLEPIDGIIRQTLSERLRDSIGKIDELYEYDDLVSILNVKYSRKIDLCRLYILEKSFGLTRDYSIMIIDIIWGGDLQI